MVWCGCGAGARAQTSGGCAVCRCAQDEPMRDDFCALIYGPEYALG